MLQYGDLRATTTTGGALNAQSSTLQLKFQPSQFPVPFDASDCDLAALLGLSTAPTGGSAEKR